MINSLYASTTEWIFYPQFASPAVVHIKSNRSGTKKKKSLRNCRKCQSFSPREYFLPCWQWAIIIVWKARTSHQKVNRAILTIFNKQGQALIHSCAEKWMMMSFICVFLCHRGQVSCGYAAHSGPAPSWICHRCCRQGKWSRKAVTLYMFLNWRLLCRSARLYTVSLMLRANRRSMVSPSSKMTLTKKKPPHTSAYYLHPTILSLIHLCTFLNKSYFGM